MNLNLHRERRSILLSDCCAFASLANTFLHLYPLLSNMKVIAVLVASIAVASAFIPKQNVASPSTKLQERLADRVRTRVFSTTVVAIFLDLSHYVVYEKLSFTWYRSLVWTCLPQTQK